MIEGILNTVSTEKRPTQEVQRPTRKTQEPAQEIQRRDADGKEKRKEEEIKADSGKKAEEDNVEKAIEDIEDAAKFFDRKLRLEIEEELGITVVKVIDGETEKVIRQIPPEELVELSKRARDLKGHLLDTEG